MNNKYQLPTERQREKLCEMLARAIIQMRALGWAGKAEQIAELADTFHNLPREIYGWGRWDWDLFRLMLRDYQCKYFGEDEAESGYVAMLDQIRNEP